MPKKELHNIAFGVNKEGTTCKVFDSEVILTSPEHIDYYKTCIKEFEASNVLLGEIDDEGQYIINEKIRRDLALLPKELAQNGYNLIEAWSHVSGKDLFFNIEIEEENQTQIASLYLIEKVSGYKNLQILKSFIAKIVQPKSDNFQDKARRVFNVQDSLKMIDEGQFLNLVLQIQARIDYWFALQDIVDMSSQIYVLRMLNLLENEGELGQKVLKEYTHRMKLEGLDNNSKHRYLTLRKILDDIIENFGGENEIFKNNIQEVKSIKAEFSTPIKKVEEIRQKQTTRHFAKKNEKTSPVKSEEKPKTAGKTAGKSAKKADKKGGGKKDKKDKKKKEKKKKEEKKSSGGGGSSKKIEKSEVKSSAPVRPAEKTEGIPSIIAGGKVIEKEEDNADQLFAVLGAPGSEAENINIEVGLGENPSSSPSSVAVMLM